MTDTPHEHDPEHDLDQDHLASGYLDGTLSSEARARVTADPQLLARVEVFSAHRQELRATSDHPDTTGPRETAITAALTEYDRLRHATPPTPSTVLRWKPRTAQRVLTLAAVVVALGVVGVSVFGTTADDTSTAAISDVAERNSQSADAGVSSETFAEADSAVVPTVTIGAIDAPATAAVTISDAAGLLALADQYQNATNTNATTEATDDVIRTQSTSPCVLDGDTFLSDVIYQGSLGVALLTADGHARIVDEECAVLLDIAR